MSFKHTARYVVVLKSGHPAAGGYHTSFTLALKHRRRLGRGARIVDRYETAPAAKKPRRKRTHETRKARCVCPPRNKRGRSRKTKSRRNPTHAQQRISIRRASQGGDDGYLIVVTGGRHSGDRIFTGTRKASERIRDAYRAGLPDRELRAIISETLMRDDV